MARKAIIAAALLSLLLVLYWAAGYWAAASFIRQTLAKQAEGLGAELRIGRVIVNPFLLQVRLSPVELTRDGQTLASAPLAMVDLQWRSLWKQQWVLERAAIEQPSVRIALDEHGALNWDFPRPGTGTPGERGGAEPLQLMLRRFSIADGQVLLEDRSRGEPVQLRVQGVQLGVSGFSTEKDNKAAYDFRAELAGGPLPSNATLTSKGTLTLTSPGVAGELVLALKDGGRLSVTGAMGLKPMSADLQVEAAAVPLAIAQPFLSHVTPMRVASGALALRGKVRIAPENEVTAAYEGALSVSDLKVLQKGAERPLLAWSLCEVEHAKLGFSPFTAEFGEVTLKDPRVRVEIQEDGRLNLAKVARSSDTPAKGPGAQISLRRLGVQGGALEFRDRSLDNPFAVNVEELAGAISGFSTIAGRPPAQVSLEGRVERYGLARIRGAIDLQSPKSLTDVRAQLRNLNLVKLNPYTVQFAGRRVEGGKIDADLRYRVRDGGLVGNNRLLLRQVQLGEKVNPRPLMDLPLDLAIALLSDSQGRINVGIPVHGDLADPKFDLGVLIAEAARAAISKVVSAPFRALAAVFGRNRDDAKAEVRFDPGSVELTPPAEENLAQIARALGERPRLALTVRGGYAPDVDPQAVQRRSVRHELARRAGYDLPHGAGPGSIDMRDAKILRTAERLFVDRGGSPLALLSLRREKRYGDALFDRLVEMEQPSAETAPSLAEARAEVIRAALAQRGIPPARVQVEAPVAVDDTQEGVPTELSLRASG